MWFTIMAGTMRFLCALSTLVLAGSCRHAPAPVVDPAIAACIPPGASAIAGLDLTRLRSTKLFPKLPGTESSTYALVVLRGSDLLVVARGDFQQAPAGGTLLNPHLALVGSTEAVAAASAQFNARSSGAPDLIARATADPVWIVARGNAVLPVTGNAANLNRFLHYTEYTVLTATIGDQVHAQVTATARTPENATRFEESLRAWVSLAALAAVRQHELAAVLQSIEIRRDANVVHASMTAGMDAAAKLLP